MTAIASETTQERLTELLEQHPLLSDYGMGYSRHDPDRTLETRKAEHAEWRGNLLASLERVSSTMRWLSENIAPTKQAAAIYLPSSYGMKYLAENDIGYITNGAFIAAGILSGYPWKHLPGDPNPRFGMSVSSIRQVSWRQNGDDRAIKPFRKLAAEILAEIGVEPETRHGEMAWTDGGNVRTLKIIAQEKAPFLLRISLDHYDVFLSGRQIKRLGIPGSYGYDSVTPWGGKLEFTVAPKEFESALRWCLSSASVEHLKEPPPIECVVNARWQPDYRWSKRAFDSLETMRTGGGRYNS